MNVFAVSSMMHACIILVIRQASAMEGGGGGHYVGMAMENHFDEFLMSFGMEHVHNVHMHSAAAAAAGTHGHPLPYPMHSNRPMAHHPVPPANYAQLRHPHQEMTPQHQPVVTHVGCSLLYLC